LRTIVILALIASFFSLTAPGRALFGSFFSSLRIAKPQSVSVSMPSAGQASSRQLQDLVAPMLADTLSHTLEEPDQAAPDLAAANGVAGFPISLPATRTDAPTLVVVGARTTELTVQAGQLRTILRQAGRADVPVPASLQGAALAVRTPRAARIQYGHCPQPVANTIQGQIQGPPPASPDFGDCVIVTEQPIAACTIPAGLDITTLVEIALEVTGMSPTQAAAFQRTFDWRTALSVAVPRFVRAWQLVNLPGGPAMLLTTAGRRGPSYVMIWSRHGMVFSLAGYGSPGDAAPVANAIDVAAGR
jgi:hypothetical protein